jgi:DNA-binding transcriptional regulator PaaX
MNASSLTRTILDHLAENRHLLIDAFLPPHPRSRLARALLGLDRRRYSSPRVAKHTISTLLCRLRKQGLVASAGTKRKTVWTITSKGRKHLERPPSQKLVITDYDLPPEDHIVRLISFDIPERQRRKRNWLRKILLACDYNLLHKSVFVGRRPLPEQVLQEIRDLDLTPYIHIVGLDKKGTLSAQ